ncbi:MAG: hypothetical protein AAB036_02600 [Elusimicrobiota bacterium]
MTLWNPWSQEAFARAKAEGKPIIAAVGSVPPPELEAANAVIEARYVAVLADVRSRPDAAARIGRRHALILDSYGFRRGVLPLASGDLESALTRLALEAAAPVRPEGPAVSPRTEAMRAQADEFKLSEAVLEEAFSALGAGSVPSEADQVEALLHCAGERGEKTAHEALRRALSARADLWRGGLEGFCAGEDSSLSACARWSKLMWDAHALTGEARWRETAAQACDVMLGALFDSAQGAFRCEPAKTSAYPADGNAQAAIALLRAQAFEYPGAADAAQKVLGFIQLRLHDPLLGLLHSRAGEGDGVWGLLGDAAWTTLAFTDSFVSTGLKTQRDFADSVLRFLFQELWERESGGFLDRVVAPDDPAILREPHIDASLNALALEGCRRLYHQKGNHNYGRWLEWGLRGAWTATGGDMRAVAPLARVADLYARGRMDFELVGRPGEAKADALLGAMQRLYLPRMVVSFVDPDDQDYILAHRLEAQEYPRLFACGADLRRVADTSSPSEVAALAASLRAGARR